MALAGEAWPPLPSPRRQALALGVAVALHAAVALAWGGAAREPAGAGTRLAAAAAAPEAAAGPAVLWLTLPPVAPAEAPPLPPEALAAPAAPSPMPASETGLGAALPQAVLRHQGGPWVLGYPDTDLGAPRLALVLALRLDSTQRVEHATAASPAAEELVQYVADRLQGAVLDGELPPGTQAVCLELAFDAEAMQVSWRLRQTGPETGRCAAAARG